MLSPVQSQTSANSANPAPAQMAFSQDADFTMFLKMLTTQMQNQNPLNPVEAADFAVQLATFSGVEQQVQTNQLLARMTERTLSGDLAGWLGTDVAAEGTVQIANEDIALHLPIAIDGTTSRVVVLRSATGQEVMHIPVAIDQSSLRIDPSIDGATPLVPGQYQATLENYEGQTALEPQRALQFQRVQEVQTGPGGAILLLASGARVDPATVTALRRS